MNTQYYGKIRMGESKAFERVDPPLGWSKWIESGIFFTAPIISQSKYGPHDYERGSGVDRCRCGCYMGRSDSSGPVDPFGACPLAVKPDITKPTFTHLFDYLSYQYPATKGDIRLQLLCVKIAQQLGDTQPVVPKPKSVTLVSLAESLATVRHTGHFRRDNVTPYVVHLRSVANALQTDDEKTVAWLHDIIEDKKATESELEGLFPSNIVVAVKTISKTPDMPYNEYLAHVKNNPLACAVKIQDMLHNLNDQPTPKQVTKYSTGLQFLLSPETREVV